MITKLSKIVNDINTIVVPPLCFGCNARLFRGENAVCTFCRNEIPLTGHNFRVENSVDRIFYGRVPVEKAAAFLRFQQNGLIAHLLHELKYNGQEKIGEFFGNWCGERFKDEPLFQTLDGIVPVPLHHKKLKARGYNQLSLFGKTLAQNLGVPYREDLLLRTQYVASQTTKNRAERISALASQFKVNPKRKASGQHWLLIDDVVTTGATLEACSRVLLQEPGSRVSILALAEAQ